MLFLQHSHDQYTNYTQLNYTHFLESTAASIEIESTEYTYMY